MKELNARAIIIGGSIGGVLAAYSLCGMGETVVLTEETDWIGGQLTSQAVPPDEHKYIEYTGCTRSYREYRNKVRNYYRNHPFIIDEIKTKQFFCPGGSSVSRLAHPPKLALKFLNEMLDGFIKKGKLKILLNAKPKNTETDADEIKSVTVSVAGEDIRLTGKYFLDGTDTGELIKLSGEKYRSGAESKAETLEFHAPFAGNKEDMQPVTYVCAAELCKEGDYTINKPAEYDYFRQIKMPCGNYNILSMYGPDSSTGKAKRFGIFDGETDENGNKLFGLFSYRRIVNSNNFKNGYVPNDITLINWPQNDYFMDNVYDGKDDANNLYMAKQLTLSLMYYLQTEVPRADGGKGYKNLKLNKEILGTSDGLAKAPYIRESRRLDTAFKVTENMIAKKSNNELPRFYDSVGVGCYHIDMHITTRTHTFFYDEAWPFEIPLRIFIAPTYKNLMPCCKNTGLTHITNGCYRLHPVEWNTGESAGLAAAYCMQRNTDINEIVNNPVILSDFQNLLTEKGIMLHWNAEEI